MVAAGGEAGVCRVARVKRDIFRKSSSGVLETHRSLSQSGQGTNDAYGLDWRSPVRDPPPLTFETVGSP